MFDKLPQRQDDTLIPIIEASENETSDIDSETETMSSLSSTTTSISDVSDRSCHNHPGYVTCSESEDPKGDDFTGMEVKLEILKEVQTKGINVVDKNVGRYDCALEELFDDLTKNKIVEYFYQKNGLKIVAPFLRSRHSTLRILTAMIIKECSCDPFCLELSLTDDIFGPLMEMASATPEEEALCNAICTLSVITQCHQEGVSQFLKFNGIEMVEQNLKSTCENVADETFYFLMDMCHAYEALRSKFAGSGVVVILINMMPLRDSVMKIGFLHLLILLTKNNTQAAQARQICGQQNLKNYLNSLCQTYSDRKHQKLVEFAKRLGEQL